MKQKKTDRADLQNKRVLFTEIGCIVALALVYFGFEYSTAKTKTASLEDTGVIAEMEDMIPITFETPPPPPAAPQIPVLSDLIEIVDDDIEVALVESTVLATYACNNAKEAKKQRVSY